MHIHDYFFMGNKPTAAKDNPILVVFDSRTNSLSAWQTYKKGAIEWVANEVVSSGARV